LTIQPSSPFKIFITNICYPPKEWCIILPQIDFSWKKYCHVIFIIIVLLPRRLSSKGLNDMDQNLLYSCEKASYPLNDEEEIIHEFLLL